MVVDSSFFLTVAGIAMSFAGFAGLMNALRRGGDAWAPMDLYQLRIIVAYAIATLFGSLSTTPFVGLFGPRAGLQWLGLMMLVVSVAIGTAINSTAAVESVVMRVLAGPASGRELRGAVCQIGPSFRARADEVSL